MANGRPLSILATLLMATITLSGCLGGSDSDANGPGASTATVEHAEPSYNYRQPAEVTGFEFVTQAVNETGPLHTAAGMWAFGDYLFGTARSDGFFIIDISRPEEPVVVYQSPDDAPTFYARDADMIVHPDGRRTLVMATQFDGMHFWDVTKPTEPEFLSTIYVDPNHNVAVVPGTTYVMNSQSGGQGRFTDIVDATHPKVPELAGTFGGYGCHDITFFGQLGDLKFRAYCAGVDRTEIWDMTLFNPGVIDAGISIISTVEFGEDQPVIAPATPDGRGNTWPARTLHHYAGVNADASVLMIGDEYNGGAEPGACYGRDENTGRSNPYGALFFYDLSNETNPVLLNWISPEPVEARQGGNSGTPSDGDAQNKSQEVIEDQEPEEAADLARPYATSVPSCTAHFGTLIPGEEKIAFAWYAAGVLLIDFTEPSNPLIIDQYITNDTMTWDARVHGGYVFTGDIDRGVDVLKLV